MQPSSRSLADPLPPPLLQFLLDLGITPLTGTTSPQHMAEDLGVLSMPDLTEAEQAGIAQLLLY